MPLAEMKQHVMACDKRTSDEAEKRFVEAFMMCDEAIQLLAAAERLAKSAPPKESEVCEEVGITLNAAAQTIKELRAQLAQAQKESSQRGVALERLRANHAALTLNRDALAHGEKQALVMMGEARADAEECRRDRDIAIKSLDARTKELAAAEDRLAQAQKEIEGLRTNMRAIEQSDGLAASEDARLRGLLSQAERDKAALRLEVEELKAAYRQQNAEAEGWKRTANELYTGNPPTEPSMVAGLKLMREHQRQRDEMKLELAEAREQTTAARAEAQRLRSGLDALEVYDCTYSLPRGEYLKRSEVLALLDEAAAVPSDGEAEKAQPADPGKAAWLCPECQKDTCSPATCWGWNGFYDARQRLCTCSRCGGRPNSLACKVDGAEILTARTPKEAKP